MSHLDPPPPSHSSPRASSSNGYSANPHPSEHHTSSHRTGHTYWKPSVPLSDTSHDRTPMHESAPVASKNGGSGGTGSGSGGTKLVLRLGGAGLGGTPRHGEGETRSNSRGSTPGEPRTARIKENNTPRRTSGRHRASPPISDGLLTPGGSAGSSARIPRTATIDDTPPNFAADDSRGPRKGRARPNGTIANGGEGDTLINDAAEGLANRLLRSRMPREEQPVVLAGVSASGKGVKVSGAAKVSGATKKRKAADVPNQDFCSACRGIGRFLCCDGCPRSFHFMCLEPPLRVDELPDEEIWYCKQCKAERAKESPESVDSEEKDKESKAIPMIIKELSKRVDQTNPHQFRLPPDIRSFFAGVGETTKGEYMDTDETRTRYDRKGFQEERDPIRLRDGKSRPVSCYICAGSSLPTRQLTTDPGSSWRQIVSCDYCALHFHLDCLNPPLATMPNSSRKWMCPNHAEQVMPRRRTLRSGIETVDVESTGTPNNGNIVVMPDEPVRERLEYEDTVINRRKYRVPERVIHLDFWAKLASKKSNKRPRSSSLSSVPNDSIHALEASQEDLEAANLVLSLLAPGPTTAKGQGVVAKEEPMDVDLDVAAPPKLTLKFPRTAV